MGLASYIVVGAVIGVIVAILVHRSGRRLLWDLALGVVGGLVGGGIGRIVGWPGVVRAFNYRSFILAVVCAILLVAAVELISLRRAKPNPQQA